VNEEIHNIMHTAVTDRVEKLEDQYESLVRPEDGVLAKMKVNLEVSVGKVESKFNWLIATILIGAGSVIATIVLSKLGFSK
jgi:hypothetical protein